MKKILLLFIPIVMQTAISHAQGFVWANAVGGNSQDEVLGVTTDAAGNVVATGIFEGTGDFNPGGGVANLSSAGGTDAFIVKTNANGSFAWAKSIGGTGTDYGQKVQADASGNVYVIGGFSGSVDFDPGPGVTMLTAKPGGSDVYVLKLDAAGNFVWAIQRQMGPATSTVHRSDLKLDASNNLYMAYSFGTTGVADTVIVEKASNTGTMTWRKMIHTTTSVSGSYMMWGSLALDGTGNILLAGTYNGSVDFDPNGSQELQSQNGPNTYVVKMSNAGTLTWVRTLQGASGSFSRGFDVTADINGNAILGGRFGGDVDFDPGAGTNMINSGASVNAYILKLTPAGNYTWVRTYGVSNINTVYGLATDAAGSLYATGYVQGNAVFGPVTFTNVNSVYEGFTLKLSPSGNQEWVQQIGGGMGSYVMGHAIAVAPNGAVYTAGGFDQTANFNVASMAGLNLTSAGNLDGFVQKVSGCAAITTTVAVAGSTITANATGATYQWFNCATNTAVAGANAKTFTAAVTGSYKVAVTQGGCTDTSICQSVIGTGIAGAHNVAATIYPSPTTGNVSVSLGKAYSNIEVTITTVMGAVVSKNFYHNTQAIDTRIDGVAGIYFISIVADGAAIARERVLKVN